MKLLTATLLFLIAFAGSSFGQDKYSTYSNSRFGFSIDYPVDLLKKQPPPDNGDGQTFLSPDGAVVMRVWGGYNAAGQSWLEYYSQSKSSLGGNASYSPYRPGWFVVSGIRNGKIFYQRSLVRSRGNNGVPEVFYTFTIEYPESRKNVFDAVVRRIAGSFKFDPKADV